MKFFRSPKKASLSQREPQLKDKKAHSFDVSRFDKQQGNTNGKSWVKSKAGFWVVFNYLINLPLYLGYQTRGDYCAESNYVGSNSNLIFFQESKEIKISLLHHTYIALNAEAKRQVTT